MPCKPHATLDWLVVGVVRPITATLSIALDASARTQTAYGGMFAASIFAVPANRKTSRFNLCPKPAAAPVPASSRFARPAGQRATRPSFARMAGQVRPLSCGVAVLLLRLPLADRDHVVFDADR